MRETIKNNRITALVYRCVAIILCLFGLLDGTGLFLGSPSGGSLLYYTNQSNILVLIVFVMLLIATLREIKKSGTKGPSSFFERTTGIVMLAISVTMLIFWFVLAPTFVASGNTQYLLTFQNFQLHLITPLLIIGDYFIFETPGKLKKVDPYIFAAIPLLYFVQATIIGLSGYVYRVDPNGAIEHFPYYFLDYYKLGWKVGLYVVLVSIFFIGLAYGLLLLDKKRVKAVIKKMEKSESNETADS
ncbi:MAG: hypothetical protein LBF12_05980 [Christensenellaceae bacterium]|jgi:hypothetical protein|nr:hypothetical protein [Christensenellaceae bacterium]